MKNSECTLYIMSKHRWIQKFRKEKDGGIQTKSNGTERSLSAEQLRSHIIPLLAGIGHFTVRVELDNKIKVYPQKTNNHTSLLLAEHS